MKQSLRGMTAGHDAAISTELIGHIILDVINEAYSSSLLFRFLASRSFAALLLFSQVSA